MTNQQIEAIYKARIDLSHDAALRAVYDAGYFECLDDIREDEPTNSADPSSDEEPPEEGELATIRMI